MRRLLRFGETKRHLLCNLRVMVRKGGPEAGLTLWNVIVVDWEAQNEERKENRETGRGSYRGTASLPKAWGGKKSRTVTYSVRLRQTNDFDKMKLPIRHIRKAYNGADATAMGRREFQKRETEGIQPRDGEAGLTGRPTDRSAGYTLPFRLGERRSARHQQVLARYLRRPNEPVSRNASGRNWST